MDPKLAAVLLAAVAATSLVSGASAVAAASLLNITEILNQYPAFSSFNSLLTETGLSSSINTHNTITVLAVNGDALGAVSGRPLDEVKQVLSLHVLLDYFDYMKLQHLSKRSSTITTLYQTSGVAEGMSGFLNVTDSDDGMVRFASADSAGRSSAGSSFVKEVYSRPYTVSVLQVSDVILLPGMSVPSQPPPKNASAASPAASPAPAPAADDAADAPAPANADAPAPANADAPAPEADSPTSDAPSPGPASASSHANADADADALSPAPAADSHSASGRATVGAGVVFAAAAALLGSL